MPNRLTHFFCSLPCPLTTIFALSGLFFFQFLFDKLAIIIFFNPNPNRDVGFLTL